MITNLKRLGYRLRKAWYWYWRAVRENDEHYVDRALCELFWHDWNYEFQFCRNCLLPEEYVFEFRYADRISGIIGPLSHYKITGVA